MGNELFLISDEYRTFFGPFIKVTGTRCNSCSREKVWAACFLSFCLDFHAYSYVEIISANREIKG